MESVTGENRKLTRAERAVLSVLVNPDYFKADNARRIEAAEVSPSRFYEIIADPWFQEQQRQAFYDIIKAMVGPIVKASIDTASEQGRDGFNDRKMLMEMSGMFQNKASLEHTGPNGGPIKTETEHKHTIDYDAIQAELEAIPAANARMAGRIASDG